VSNAGTAIALILLSIFLIYLHRRIKYKVPYSSILLWFALIGISCAAVYALDIYTIWVPAYYLSSIGKVSIAVVWVCTTYLISPTISKILNLVDNHEIAMVAHQEPNTKFKEAFDHATIGMALVGLDGRWLKVNRSLCEIVGCSEEELLTKTLQEITHPEDVEHDLEHVQEVIEGRREGYRIEKRFYRKNGRLLWVLLSVSLVRNSEGDPLYFIHQVQDITKRKAIEYGMIDLTAQLYAEVDGLKSQEISERIEKILEEVELFENLAKRLPGDVY
jgi:PAS domain S-box-containing protein